MAEATNSKPNTQAVMKSGSKPRSPNYPAVGLEEAVRRVKKMYEADGRAGAPVDAAAKHIGFSGAHGSALVVLSALKKFGLLDDKKGRLVPTQLAIDILTFPEGTERRTKALRTAALSPTAYQMVIDQFKGTGQLPSDTSLRPELVADRGFTEKSVDGFLKDMRASLNYAGLLKENKLLLSEEGGDEAGGDTAENTPNPKQTPAKQTPKFRVGDVVQWEVNGILKLPDPKRIVGFYQDGWAYLEDSETGVPVGELVMVEEQRHDPAGANQTGTPPPNPHFRPAPKREEMEDTAASKPGMSKAETTLDEGPVIIRWPGNLTEDSFHDFEYFLKGVIRQARRKAGLKPGKKSDGQDDGDD